MTSKTLRFIFHHPLKQWPTGKKKRGSRKTKTSRTERYIVIQALLFPKKREITGISFKDMDQVTLVLCETLTE